MRHHYREFIIMSAERPNEDNFYRNSLLTGLLNEYDVNYKKIRGYYKGDQEVSYMIFLNYDFNLEFFESLAKKFDQECILYRDKYNKCYLHYNDVPDTAMPQYIGTFKEVDSVHGLDSYSIIGGKYYAVC